MSKKKALVGFSVNTELSAIFDGRTQLEKAPLQSINARIGGTSANVATAIQKLGGEIKLLTLIGINDDFPTHILNYVLEKCDISHKDFKLLDQSHIALLPDDGIQRKKSFGLKGKIDDSKMDSVLAEIDKEDSLWRIATGVRVEEYKLVEFLFNKHVGFRSLNPRMELIRNKQIFKILLKNTDLLICNMAEFEACEVTSPSSLHEYGPSLVIVTDEEKGGIFSLKSFKAERFHANKSYIGKKTPIYTTGAGDWFNGAFTAMCQDYGKPFNELSYKKLIEFINFAARVAGKKVTIEGSSNGPSKEEL